MGHNNNDKTPKGWTSVPFEQFCVNLWDQEVVLSNNTYLKNQQRVSFCTENFSVFDCSMCGSSLR